MTYPQQPQYPAPSAFSIDADQYEKGGGGQTQIFIQRFKNPETKIRLCQEPNNDPNQMKTMREHYSTRFKESFACPNFLDNGVPCVGCSDPDQKTRKRNRRFITNAINDRGELVLYKMGPDLHQKFVNKRQRLGTVLDRDWVVVKSGSGLSTDYEPWETPDGTYYVPMPTELINIDQVLIDGYNAVAQRYLSTPVPPAPPYGASPFITPSDYVQQPYGQPVGYGQSGQPPQPSFTGQAETGVRGATPPAPGRIQPTYATAGQQAPAAPPGPPQAMPPHVADPWSVAPGQPQNANDPWTTPPPPNDTFAPSVSVPPGQIQPQYGPPAGQQQQYAQPQPPAAAPGTLFSPPAVDPGPAPWEQPGADAVPPAPPQAAQQPAAPQPPSQAQQVAAAMGVQVPQASPPAAADPSPDAAARKPKDMTIKELKAWLSDPEREVEYPANAARSRLVHIAERWLEDNPAE